MHRDLKPENVFVSREGRIKILDFGLAKLVQKPGAADAESDGVTLTGSHTVAGVIMGTASYMAPEQVRGKVVSEKLGAPITFVDAERSGGGAPVNTTLFFTQDSSIKPNQTVSAQLVDESEFLRGGRPYPPPNVQMDMSEGNPTNGPG